MDTHTSAAPQAASPSPWGQLYAPSMVGRDLGYILPGFPVAIVSFSLLLTLTLTSISTIIIWVGVLLLPLTLVLASAFAELSRARLRWWSGAAETPRYLERGEGRLGMLRILRDPRRWLDLAFEGFVAFPLRLSTFVVSITWLSVALGGLTWTLWGYFLPHGGEVFPANFLIAISDGSISREVAESFWAEAAVHTVFGVVACALLPPLMRGLALLDAVVVRVTLCASPFAPSGGPAGHTAAGALPALPAPLPSQRRSFGNRMSSPEGWAWIIAGYAAVILIAVGWPLLATLYSVHVAIAMVIVIGHAAGLLLAIRVPAAAVAIATIAPAATALITAVLPGVPWPWPVSMLIVQCGIVLIVALRHSWPWALAAWALPQLAVVAALVATGPGAAALTPGAVANLVVTASVSLGIAVLGVVIRAFASDRGALVEERRANAELDAKQRELAERNIVARELHDVVAHSMSVVSIQANTAKYRIPGLGDAAEAEFAAIAQSSRQALTEMRSLLATLRAPEGSAPLVPQPTLEDLPALIEASRQSGATIAYRAEGLTEGEPGAGPAGVPASTALTVFRVTQEALSNAMRHSPGAAIEVSVRATSDGVEVAVVNGPGEAQSSPSAGSGMGLSGLSERVAALGGTIEAGPAADGGFSLRATLPL